MTDRFSKLTNESQRSAIIVTVQLSRLETKILGLQWSQEQLVLMSSLIFFKPGLSGIYKLDSAWDRFFHNENDTVACGSVRTA